jgi:hypothetical protein
MFDESNLENMKHILQFSSANDEPELYVRESGLEQTLKLTGEQNFSFSSTKACIGFKTDVDRKSCKRGAMNIKQCPTCQYRDVARVYTVGDFTLYPHLHEQLDTEKYVIYLAQFGSDITKVGLTRRSRFRQRWKEQGADLAVALLEFDGPNQAYPAEQALHSMFDLTQAVRVNQKIKRLQFDKEKALARLTDYFEQVRRNDSISPYLTDEKIEDLSSFYPNVFNPEPVDFVGGKVLGAKGQLLLFEGPTGQHYAVNMSAQVGRFLEEKKTGTDGQMSLF